MFRSGLARGTTSEHSGFCAPRGCYDSATVSPDNPVAVDAVMAELQGRVRERVRQDLLRHGASAAFEDAAIFSAVEDLFRRATDRSQPAALLLPEVIGQPSAWRLDTAMRYQSHRGGAAASFILFIKRRLLMPALRW